MSTGAMQSSEMTREQAWVGLRDGAVILGVKPSDLSSIEAGIVDNSGLEPCY